MDNQDTFEHNQMKIDSLKEDLEESKELLKESLEAFNDIVNTKYHGGIKNTYLLASKINKFLKK